MRGRGILLGMALVLSAGLLPLLRGEPARLAAQDSPLAQESPLLTPPAVDSPQPAPTATPTATATAAATRTPTVTPSATPGATSQATSQATATRTPTPAAPRGSAGAAAPATGIAALDLDEFDAFVADAVERFDAPGAAVAIIADDAVLLAEGYGVRQLGAAAPVDADTRFQLGSASHFLLASGAAALAGAGAVELDRPVVEYLPEFDLYDAYAGDHTTLRDLFAHRTGLPANRGDLIDKMGFERSAALAQLQFLPPAVSFRERDGFTNLGIFAAGEVLAAAENMAWEEILAERIFAPLGMSRSSGYYDALLEDENVAAAHFADGAALTVGDWADLPVLSAAGQSASTAADLAAWMRMLLAAGEFAGEPVLTAEQVAELFAPASVGGDGGPLHDPLSARCLGCTTYYYRGHRIVEAAGAAPGTRALLLLAPDDDLGLVVLANRDLTALPEAVRGAFLEAVFGPAGRDLQADARNLAAGWQEQSAPPAPPPDPFEPTLALTAYAGQYTSDFYGAWTITSLLGEDRLEVAAGQNGFPGDLLPFDGDTFLLTWDAAGAGHDLLTFTVGEDGSVAGFTSPAYGDFTRTGE